MRLYILLILLVFIPIPIHATDISPLTIETYEFQNQVFVNDTRVLETIELPHAPHYLRARMSFASNESSTLFTIIEYKIAIHLYSSSLSMVPVFSSELITLQTPDELEIIAPIYLVPDTELFVRIEILRGFNHKSILSVYSIIDLITMPSTYFSRTATTRTMEQEFHLNKSLLLGDVEQTAIFLPPDILPEFNQQYDDYSMQLRFPFSVAYLKSRSTIRLSVGDYKETLLIEEPGEYEFVMTIPIQSYYTVNIGFQGELADIVLSDVEIEFIPNSPLRMSKEMGYLIVSTCLLAPVTIIIRIHKR
ncbi:MAG: hypothetical protein INQ03_08900 [Candidatus Heimdallarchaeota archaeon]|nr:hypothetical protein [Candidatus Heimdallarchaeota archaeon]